MSSHLPRLLPNGPSSLMASPRTPYDVPPLGSRELRRLDVRVHGVLSALTGLVAMAMAPLSTNVVLVETIGVGALVAGAVHLLVDAGRFSGRSLTVGHLIAVVGVLLSTSASGHSLDLAAGPILCVIVTVHAACFRSARETWFLVGWSLLCYSVLLALTISTLRTFGATCVLATTLAPTAFTLTRLRRRVDLLVGELHRMADHDVLTGLLNREGLRRRADDTVRTSTSDRGMLALLLLDVDRFKALNDELGHPAGDDALAWLGAHLRSCVRDPAVVGRYGGEEFVVLLPIDSVRAGRERAEDIRRSVELAGRTRSRPITVSIGVAVGPCEDDFYHLYERADLALYAAKAAGRNRVEVSGEPDPAIPGAGPAGAVVATERLADA